MLVMFAVLLRYRRFWWLRHIYRKDKVRLPLQMMFSTERGSEAKGRPMKSWMTM